MTVKCTVYVDHKISMVSINLKFQIDRQCLANNTRLLLTQNQQVAGNIQLHVQCTTKPNHFTSLHWILDTWTPWTISLCKWYIVDCHTQGHTISPGIHIWSTITTHLQTVHSKASRYGHGPSLHTAAVQHHHQASGTHRERNIVHQKHPISVHEGLGCGVLGLARSRYQKL